MNTFRSFSLFLLTIWGSLLFPYLLVGKTWSLILFDLCRPTSVWWKTYLSWLALKSWAEIAAVTLVHSFLIAGILCVGLAVLKRTLRGRSTGEASKK